MSLTLTITGDKSMLESRYMPSLTLDGLYECGLIYFSAFNSIPNIDHNNNVFSYGREKNEIKIPTGLYDLYDINEYLADRIENCEFQIRPNNNTMKCAIFCSKPINFDVENSIGSLLGFEKVTLEANKWHESAKVVNILPTTVIRIECDLVQGSYTNGALTHIIYEFVPNVPPGHRFVETPSTMIYFPVKQSVISEIHINILDLDGNQINFRGESIQLCLHLRKRR